MKLVAETAAMEDGGFLPGRGLGGMGRALSTRTGTAAMKILTESSRKLGSKITGVTQNIRNFKSKALGEWFKAGETSLMFFKEGLTPWVSLCRVPIKNVHGKETIFFIHTFGAVFTFPTVLKIAKNYFEGMESTSVDLMEFEKFIEINMVSELKM